MPNLFIIDDQTDAAALVTRLLPSRANAADRVAAEEALRAANPTLDLRRLRPGMVIVVPPTIERLRRGAADDPAGDAAGDLVDEVRAALEALEAAAKDAQERAAGERQEAFALLDGPVVSRLAGDQLLAANIESVRQAMKADEAAGPDQVAALRQSLDQWQADLKALRELL